MANRVWQVTSQSTGQVTVNQAGNVVEGVIVYFITGQGNEGSVFIPNTAYSAANVRARVDQAAATLDEVGNLSSGQGGAS
jgi:hypothetical protein